MGIKNVKYKVEHHFEKKCVLPSAEQITPSVKIVVEGSEGELIIEKSDTKKCLDLSIGGIRITLPVKAVIRAIFDALKVRVRVWWWKTWKKKR